MLVIEVKNLKDTYLDNKNIPRNASQHFQNNFQKITTKIKILQEKNWNATIEYNLYNAVYEMEFSAAQYFQTVTQTVQFIFYFTLYL